MKQDRQVSIGLRTQWIPGSLGAPTAQAPSSRKFWGILSVRNRTWPRAAARSAACQARELVKGGEVLSGHCLGIPQREAVQALGVGERSWRSGRSGVCFRRQANVVQGR